MHVACKLQPFYSTLWGLCACIRMCKSRSSLLLRGLLRMTTLTHDCVLFCLLLSNADFFFLLVVCDSSFMPCLCTFLGKVAILWRMSPVDGGVRSGIFMIFPGVYSGISDGLHAGHLSQK